MRLPISPFHGTRSRPGISRPNLTHFTMRTAAGCAEVAAPELLEFFSSAISVSWERLLQFKILHWGRKFQLTGGKRAACSVAPTALANRSAILPSSYARD